MGCKMMLLFMIMPLIFEFPTVLHAARPKWASRIQGNGGDDKFRNIKKDIISKTNIGSFNANSIHLAHVFPWAGIDECVDYYKQNNNGGRLTNFVTRIFGVDANAVVPQFWKKANLNDDRSFTPQSFVSHRNYLGVTLRAENTLMLNEALKDCVLNATPAQQRNCKYLLYNAPANLRFGLGEENITINDRLDLMGAINGRRTTKEVALINEMNDCYDELPDWCIRNNEYCGSTNNGFKILSSSSNNPFVYL